MTEKREEKDMKPFAAGSYDAFDLFSNRLGLVTAGDKDHYNACTVAWGSLGTIWGGPGKGRPVATVYINPDRYTYDFLRESDQFTVSFYADRYKDALWYLGSHSGRDEDKIKNARFTPKFLEGGVTFEQAELTFVCRKLYEGPFERKGLADEINNGIYKGWEPHWMFVGEIVGVDEEG